MRRRSLSESDIAHRLALARGLESPLDVFEGGQRVHPTVLRPAAVLLPLIWEQESWHLLFTHRAATVEHHRDEVAFPGGSCLAGETPEETALREAWEEIGLGREIVRVLGCLPEIITSTAYRVTPVVGRIVDWPCELRPAPQEVTRIFTIPLDWLARRRHWRIVPYVPPSGGIAFPVIVYRPYAGEVLWGVSARITHIFLRSLGW